MSSQRGSLRFNSIGYYGPAVRSGRGAFPIGGGLLS